MASSFAPELATSRAAKPPPPPPLPPSPAPRHRWTTRVTVGAASRTAEVTQEITDHAPAGLAAVQAASCRLRECIPQRSIHLLRVLGFDMTKEFCKSVDETVLKAATRILDLPNRLDWQKETLFIPADRGGWPTKEQSVADLRALALKGFIKENDALTAGFDVEAFDILRRTPTDSALVTGGQSRIQRKPHEVIAKPAKPTYAPGWTGQAGLTRTARKRHQERQPGSKRAQWALHAPSTTPTSRSKHVSV